MDRSIRRIVAGLIVVLASHPCIRASAPEGQGEGEGEVRIAVRVDLGADLGQELGSLFEARDPAGKVVAGAGFLGVNNTMDRGDRRQLQFFLKVPDDGGFDTAPLPRPSPGAGVYAFGLDNRLFAAARSGEVDTAVRAWDDAKNAWTVDPRTRKYDVRIGDEVMSITPDKLLFGGRTIFEPPTANDRLTEPYYGSGILLVRSFSKDGFEPASNVLAAFSWKPGEGAVRWNSAKILPLRPREFVYTYGQLAGKIFMATNIGTVAVLEAGTWRVLRAADGKSFQIYASLNYRDRMLLGQYPSGELFEFDGKEMRQLRGWPPVMPGVSTNAREAQTLAIHGGDLYVGVWPWGEVWRLDSSTQTWRLLGRMFTHPEPTKSTTHPYEDETKALDPVLNRWGQRVTSMVPLGDSLYIATSAKSAAPYEEKFTFLAGDKWREYGTVHRHRRPGSLSVPFRWKPNPTTFEFVWNSREARVLQDGKPLGAIPWPSSLGVPKAPAKVERGRGIFGDFSGTVLPDPDEAASRAAPGPGTPAGAGKPFLAAYIDLSRCYDPKDSEADQRRSIAAMLDRFAASGLTTAMPFANTSSGAVYYPSEIVSRRAAGWDVLGHFIAEARARKLAVWPAFCCMVSGNFEPKGILLDHPEWALRQPDGKPWGFLSPAHPEARGWLASVLEEIVDRYRPDGLLLDYLRYFNRPWRLDAEAAAALDRDVAALGPADDATRKRYRQARHEQYLTDCLVAIREKALAKKPDLKLAIYSWGPHVSRNHLVAQPWPTWAEKGLIDHVNISGYYYRKQNGEKYLEIYRKRLAEAIALAGGPTRRTPVTVAIGIETSHGAIDSAGSIGEYLDAAREEGVDGAAMFTWARLEPFRDELGRLGTIPRFAEETTGEASRGR